MSGVGSGDHHDALRTTLATAQARGDGQKIRLAVMTEQTSTETSEQNAVIVETFLNSLQDQDFAAVDALIADDIVYQNVGLPTIRGGNRVKKLLRAWRAGWASR